MTDPLESSHPLSASTSSLNNNNNNSTNNNQPQVQQDDTRNHVISELYETEKSYVESLDVLVNKYMSQLKNSDIIEASQVDEIFHQIPQMLLQHQSFLSKLDERISPNLDNLSEIKIGDVLIDAFTKEPIMSDTYTSFVNNWKTAKESIKNLSGTKASFVKFIENASREHKGKLSLDALLIMPVQRIPRYELLLKELIKHTTPDHPDHQLLITAQKEVHELALKINRMEKESFFQEQNMNRLKEIEHLIEGVIDLFQPDRNFIRYDFVTIPGGLGIKKDRCLFLFSDLLLITSIKRKGGGVSRKASAAAAAAAASA